MKKSQIAINFTWIFILVAGAIILIFFVSLVFKQRAVSEEKLSATVITQLQLILTGAGLSSGTINTIDMPETEIHFICDEKGYSGYRIKNIDKNTPTQIFFAPNIIQGKKFVTWALEFNAPFKITNFLYLSDPGVKYVFVGDTPFQYQELVRNLPKEFIKESVASANTISIRTAGFHHIKFIFFNEDPTTIGLQGQLQSQELDVSAIRITAAKIQFYKRQAGVFIKQGTSFPFLDSNSVYAAIFSQDAIFYECAMKKAIKRLHLIANIQKQRQATLERYFIQHAPPGQDCDLYYDTEDEGPLPQLVAHTENCLAIRDCIEDIKEDVTKISYEQSNLIRKSCPLLY